MALPKNINLNTDKRNPLVYEGLTLRQSEQNLVMQATLLNPDKSPYDLSGGKTVTFNEHKQNDKFVVDTGVQIVDASHGNISYTLNKQCFAASGEGWFEIVSKDGQVVDSTQIFRMTVLDAANANIVNTNYINKLDKLQDQMQSMIDSADGQLKNELQNAQKQLNTNVDAIKKTYNDLTIGFQNQFKQAQDSRAQSGSDALNKFNSDSQNAIDTFNTNGNKAISDFKTNSDSKVNSNISNWSAQWEKAYSDFNNKLAQDQKSYEDTLKKLQNEVNSDTTTATQLTSTLSDLNKKVSDTSAEIEQLKSNFNSTVFAKASDVYTKEESDANLKSLSDELDQSLQSYGQLFQQTEQNLETNLAQLLDGKADESEIHNLLNGQHSAISNGYDLNNLHSDIVYANGFTPKNAPSGVSQWTYYLAIGDSPTSQFAIEATNSQRVWLRTYSGANPAWSPWVQISNTTTYTNQDIDNKINAHQPDLSGINSDISNLQGQYNALKTKVDGINNKEYIHVATNETDAANYAKAHPDVVVILKGS